MADVLCQYVTGDITGSNSTASITGFTVVDPLSTLILPAGSRHDTASVGRVSGTALPPWLFHHISADLADDGTSIALQRDKGTDPASIQVRAAVQLITYTGVDGGANEFIRRFKATVTLANTATSVDSGNITGFTDITRCVPIAYCRTNRSSRAMAETMIRVQIVDVSGNKRVRLSRGLGNGDVVAIVYVWEFTGSNWVIRTVDHTFTAGDANEDDTISTTGGVPAFVIRTGTTVGGNNGPSHGTQFSYPTSSTNLRQRLEEKATTANMTSYLIGNSQLVVEKLGTPAGSYPLTQVTSPQTENITVTALPSLSTAAFVFQAGSNIDVSSNNPGGSWGGRFTTTTNFEARRGDSVGASDYVLFSIDMSGLNFAPSITSVTDIADGGTFTITGTNLKPGGTAPTVAIDGVSQTVGTTSSTSVACTVVIGALKYGDHTLTLTTTQASVSVPVTVDPPAGEAYVNLIQLLTSGNRVTASPDIAVGDQLHWDDDTVQILGDGQIISPSGVTSFNFRVNDSTGWGTTGTQTRADPIVAPTLVGTIPSSFPFNTLDAIQLNVAQYGSGWTSLTLVDPTTHATKALPLGLTESSPGVITGSVLTSSTTTYQVKYTNEVDSTYSGTFSLAFTPIVVPPPPVLERPRHMTTSTRQIRPVALLR